MGSLEGEGDVHEYPQHEVTVPEFDLTRAPLTNGQYRRFIEGGDADRR